MHELGLLQRHIVLGDSPPTPGEEERSKPLIIAEIEMGESSEGHGLLVLVLVEYLDHRTTDDQVCDAPGALTRHAQPSLVWIVCE